MSSSVYPIINSICKIPFIVVGIGFEDHQQHILRKDGFPTHQIFFCKSGEGVLNVLNKTYTITKNTYFYLQQNIPHEYYGCTDAWEVEWIAFAGNNIDDVLSELGLNCTKTGIITNISVIQSLFAKIYNTLKANKQFETILSSHLLYELLVELFIMSQNHKDISSNISTLVNSVKTYIDEHYSQDILLSELSDLVKVTPAYLCRVFKRYMNIRPFEYLTLKRIQESKYLLSSTKMTVSDIAKRVGYHDCSYFCAMFRKYQMLSPSEFRGGNG